jgi:hypothetical protein
MKPAASTADSHSHPVPRTPVRVRVPIVRRKTPAATVLAAFSFTGLGNENSEDTPCALVGVVVPVVVALIGDSSL